MNNGVAVCMHEMIADVRGMKDGICRRHKRRMGEADMRCEAMSVCSEMDSIHPSFSDGKVMGLGRVEANGLYLR